ncbi:MAG: hypothetical protein JRF17_08370 [Deltaproteobacteria bacterium]|jgi:hypothetical protein|nr:hypothetical protein [Deltaproteobacteria bacterium]MBW2492853.1 hypothetical protein [Deltaproteobacteria bacterium]
MDFKYHLETAWKLTLQHIAPLIFMTLAMIVISFITLGILGPVVLAGYMHATLLLIRQGREPKIQDIFSHMRLFFPLLLFGVIVFIITLVGMMLLFLPGLLFVLSVSFCCIYMLPLMTDKNLGLIDAIKESFSMVTKEQLVDHVVVFILFIGISAIGSSVFIGALFTQPLATLFLMSVYDSLGKSAPETPPGPPPSPAPLTGE